MIPTELLLSVEPTPTHVLVHYRVVNRTSEHVYVRNVYRSLDAKWSDKKAPWSVASRVNLHPVGNTMLMLHTMDYFPIYTPFHEHPNLLWSTRVGPGESRDYTIRLEHPLKQYEMFGGDVPEAAVLVTRAVLRLEYAAGGPFKEVDGYPGLYRVGADRCLSAGVDLPEPLPVHPMAHSPGNPDANDHPSGVPWYPAGLPSAELAKRIWDQRYGRFD